MTTFMLWLVGASLVFALLSFLFTDMTTPPSGGDDNVPWEDSEG